MGHNSYNNLAKSTGDLLAPVVREKSLALLTNIDEGADKLTRIQAFCGRERLEAPTALTARK